MPEIIVKFPYRKINMPRNCCHCGSYDISTNIEISRPSPQVVNMEQEGSGLVRKIKRINIPVYLCENCDKNLKNKKKITRLISISALVIILILTWQFLLPLIYNISQDYKGHVGGLLFFISGLFSMALIFVAIGVPAYITNQFTGVQILSYNPKQIIIRFYNNDFAGKFFDLNDINESHVIKRKS